MDGVTVEVTISVCRRKANGKTKGTVSRQTLEMTEQSFRQISRKVVSKSRSPWFAIGNLSDARFQTALAVFIADLVAKKLNVYSP